MSARAQNLLVARVQGWDDAHPWLEAGVTLREPDGGPDFGLFRDADTPAKDVVDNWRRLLALGAWTSVVHSRQVHGVAVRVHRDAPEGIVIAGDGDGHATRAPGLLLAVAAADCTPVFLADPMRRAVALLHAGWRGVAGGVIEAGVSALRDAFGSRPEDLAAHLGPAIGGCCYEVGPEVLAALAPVEDGGIGKDEEAASPETREVAGSILLDLGKVVQARLLSSGLLFENLSRNGECTRCGGREESSEAVHRPARAAGRYFSHRRGDRERHVAFIGIRQTRSPPSPGLCGRCAWSRLVATARGSIFRLCRRHRANGSFPKYPRLPVLTCPGFEDSAACGEAASVADGPPSLAPRTATPASATPLRADMPTDMPR